MAVEPVGEETAEVTSSRKRTPLFYAGLFLLLYLAFTALFLTLWVKRAMPGTDTESIIFQLKVPLEGTDWSAYYGMFRGVFLWAPLCAAGLCILSRFLKIRRGFKLLTAAALMLGLWGCGLHYISFFSYVHGQLAHSEIYEEYYADPEKVAVTFPEKKRNLIYIYLESMEITFTDTDKGGVNSKNPISKLTEVSLQNENFGDGTVLNGPVSTVGTTWTMASFVAQNTGVPLSIPISMNSMDRYDSFLPGAYSLGQLLEREGYREEVIIGSKKTFSGFDTFLLTHGNPNVIDLQAARDAGFLPSKDYKAWWGYEDRYLFEIAKKRLAELSEGDEPFSLTLMTMDTHRVNGYKCALCRKEYELQYENVLACSDTQVTEFLSWLAEQDFYENTTIILAGDHQTMDGDYVATLTIPDSYERKQYYAVVNGAAERENTGVRHYTTEDLFPTTLAAMGCEIEGDRLGLGTNLYSGTPTLLEEKGLDWLDGELGLQSVYYNKHLLYGE